MHILGLVAAKEIKVSVLHIHDCFHSTMQANVPQNIKWWVAAEKEMKVNQRESTAYHCGPPPVRM